MSTRLDTCMEALRSLARSSELEANRLPTAELRIRDFLTPVGTNHGAQRAALEELDNAVSREASGSNTIIRGWHHFCQHSSMAMLLIGTPIISGGSEEVVGKVRMRLGPISLPKLKPTRAEGHKRLISPLIRSPRWRVRAASAALQGREPWRS